METKRIAWSYSRLKQFRDCPKAFYHKNIARKGHPDHVAYVETSAKNAGLEVDAALTARVLAKQPLPEEYKHLEEMCQVIDATPGSKIGQARYCLDQSYQQVGYNDWQRGWVRVIYDVGVINGEHAWLGDWKNGKVWVDEGQLALFAATGFILFPEVQKIDTSYIWLSHGFTSDKTYLRKDMSDIWMQFLPDVERLQLAADTNNWPAAPLRGKSTCAYCDVNKAGKCASAAGPYKGR